MNSVLVETRESFAVSAGNIIRDSFSKTQLPSLSPPNMKTNTQACVASIQTYSKGINDIAEDTLSPIQLLKTRTKNHMVTLRAKGSNRKTSRNILLWAVAYNMVQNQTVLPLQETKN